jgi:hypothetical protein
MRAFVSILTAVAFLLHMWLGCCAHHAHAEETTCDRHEAADQHADYAHDHPGHETPCQQLPEEGDSPCPTEPCSEGECVFLKVGKLEFDGPAAVAHLPAPVSDSLAGLSPAKTREAIDSGGLAAPPVRLHLAHQVLLI